MANYRYTAKNSTGKSVTGVDQAESEAAVLRILSQKGLFPLHVGVADDAEKKRSTSRRRIRRRHIGTMFRQMADLLRSGVPMLRTLQTLENTSANPALAEVIRDLRGAVSQGRPLADAVGDSVDVFDPLHEAVIRAGEEGGFLEDVLQNLGDLIERSDELRSRVLGLMLYPLLLALFGGTLVVLILIFLVPKFKMYFADMDLPIPTKIIFYASDLLTEHFVLLLALLVLAGAAFCMLVRSGAGRRIMDAIRLGLPIIGRINRSVSVTRICRVLGTMINNGVPILRALSISRDAAGSVALTDAMNDAIDNVRDGQPLAAPLKASGQFDAEIVEMIAVAEESNRMETVLVQIADTLERRTNRQIDHVVRLVEPLIIVMMAVTIAFIALGLLYPVFLLSKALQ